MTITLTTEEIALLALLLDDLRDMGSLSFTQQLEMCLYLANLPGLIELHHRLRSEP